MVFWSFQGVLNGNIGQKWVKEYFEYILRKHGEDIEKFPVRINVKRTENRITFKINTGYYLGY